ncbi:MAG: hypothetical protein V3T70_00035 [Phycisphaerae bacterium]
MTDKPYNNGMVHAFCVAVLACAIGGAAPLPDDDRATDDDAPMAGTRRPDTSLQSDDRAQDGQADDAQDADDGRGERKKRNKRRGGDRMKPRDGRRSSPSPDQRVFRDRPGDPDDVGPRRRPGPRPDDDPFSFDRPSQRRRGFQRDLAPEQLEEIFALLQEHFPEMYERLTNLRNERPEEFERALQRFIPFMRDVLNAEPEMRVLMINDHRLQMQIERTAKRVRRAGAGEQNRIRKELRRMLEKQFDLRMQKHSRMIEHVEQRLSRQRDMFEQRMADKELLIQARLDELTARPTDLEWPQ